MSSTRDDLELVLRDRSLPEIRARLTANGIERVEIELLHGWFSTGERRLKAEG